MHALAASLMAAWAMSVACGVDHVIGSDEVLYSSVVEIVVVNPTLPS